MKPYLFCLQPTKLIRHANPDRDPYRHHLPLCYFYPVAAHHLALFSRLYPRNLCIQAERADQNGDAALFCAGHCGDELFHFCYGGKNAAAGGSDGYAVMAQSFID